MGRCPYFRQGLPGAYGLARAGKRSKVEDILAKLDRVRRKLEEIKPGCTTRAKRKAKPIV